MKKILFPLVMVSVLALAACTPATVAPTEPSTQVPTTAPTAMPTATAEPTCPEPTEGEQLFRNERYGYCLLYPAGYFQVGPLYRVAIAPEGFVFWETPGPLSITVADAAGLSASQWVDMQMVQAGGFGPERSSLILAGEEAILLPEVHGQASTREVIIVHEDRRYTLSFMLPDPGDAPAVEQFERLFSTVTGSFTFIPIATSPMPIEPGEAGRGSALVAYIKDGNVLVWDEATGQSQTVFDAGDVIRVEMSDDGQMVAFVRATSGEAGGQPQESALWVVERDGSNPREIVSASELRARIGASEAENVELPCLEWIPNSHRLLYSGLVSPPAIGAGCLQWFTRGLFLLDADTLAQAELAPANEAVDFLPSPDGRYVAILFSTGPAFASVNDALAGNLILTRPAGEVPVLYCGPDCASFGNSWTQDSSALIVIDSRVYDRTLGQEFTIWRVPADGSPAEPLTIYRGVRAQLSPDGSVAAFVRRVPPAGQSRRFLIPLPEDLGPLSVRADPLGLPWSPDSVAYILGSDEMIAVCPNASQAIEICGAPIDFGTDITSFQWLDRNRFLYVTYLPRRLMLGSLDGSATIITEDPGPVDSNNPGRVSFDAAASTCVDDSEFVLDVTVSDGTHLGPGTFFIKTWRLRNTGTCTWDDAYRFTFLSGDRLSGPRSAALDEPVEPGGEVEVSVGLVAPEEAGTYQGQWQMFARDGTPFGTNMYVVIVVP